MAADTWASLPCDLLIEILRRLAATAIIRCAGACRPWRRTIVGNASSLGPRPALLIGFFHSGYVRHRASSPIADLTSYTTLFRAWSPDAPLFVTAGFALYRNPLSSCGGFVLLDGGVFAADLCLCNPTVGRCWLLPAAMAAGAASYVLVTGHDVACTDDGSEVWIWILAVKREDNVGPGGGMAYRIFSSASGVWGPAKRSARLELEEETQERTHAYRYGDPVVCRGGAVYCLGEMYLNNGGRRAFAFAIDVRTERTWTTELPEKYAVLYYRRVPFSSLFLATSGEDGQLSLFVSLRSRQIEVWVAVGDDGQWMLRRKIDVPEFIPSHCKTSGRAWLRTYCYSSGFLFVEVDERDLVIAVDEDLQCPIKQIVRGRVSRYPYEMDWLTYVSMMKHL